MIKSNQKTQTYEYQAEMKQLLHLIVHSLYTHPEVFLRELISNASDALNKVRLQQLTDENILDNDKKLEIKIEADEKKQILTINDSGIGMTRKQLVDNIGTIARSGTVEFLQKMKEENKNTDDLIGKFGIGFYSVFMVTDKVTIETRHSEKDSKGFRWTSTGEGKYTIEEIDKPERGTKISFKLKDDAKEFAQEYKVKETIKKYSNFADFPIYVGTEQANTVEPVWRKPDTIVTDEELNEFYKFVTNEYENPLAHLQLSIENPDVSFKALLFIPQTPDIELFRIKQHKSVQLYSNKIMIMDDCKDLLPSYLQFVRGVVDTIDLPLNVSREMTQASPLMNKIKGILTSKILQWLQKLSKNDKETYLKFYKAFSPLFKMGLSDDYANKDKLVELLRFETSSLKEGELNSLKEYTGRMKENQKEIYYLSGENREQVECNPNLEYFKKHNIEVLFMIDPGDVFVMPSITEYDKNPVRAIDRGDLDLDFDKPKQENTAKNKEDEKKKDEDMPEPLIGLFKEILKDKIEDVKVSKRLVDSAVTLVAGSKGMDPQLERMMKGMGKSVYGSKKIMEINLEHPVIKNLKKKYLSNASDPSLKKYIFQLCEGAQLINDELQSRTDYVKRMTDIIEEATK